MTILKVLCKAVSLWASMSVRPFCGEVRPSSFLLIVVQICAPPTIQKRGLARRLLFLVIHLLSRGGGSDLDEESLRCASLLNTHPYPGEHGWTHPYPGEYVCMDV